MESAPQDQGSSDGVTVAVGYEPSHQSKEVSAGRPLLMGGKHQREADHVGVPQWESGTVKEKVMVGDQQEEEEGVEEEGEGCLANSTMCSVKNAGQTNGGAELASSSSSPKTPSKSPSANRTGRRNQVFREPTMQ
ncbi:uncharacterized protein LOC143496532 [Brachyhypopomus gauderio]|uniref:uncharacterized protein LOC143496532 n=1 Tax=Brachyhypopomus gauderio TaxID=698409 RepID=UPI0040427970